MARVVAIVFFCLIIGFVAWALLKQRLGRPREQPPAQDTQRRVANPPNFVVVVGESIGCGDLGCYGQKHIATPHLDRLAREGVRLSEFYAGDPTGAASCWCLLTGHDMAAAKNSGPSRFALRPQQATVAEVLRRAGYETGFVGPWSLGGDDPANTPGPHGFTEWATLPLLDGQPRPHPDTFWRNGQRVRVTSNMDGKQGQYVTDLILQEAVAFLQQHKSGHPFFLFVACPLPRDAETLPSLRAYTDTNWPPARKSYAARVTEFDRLVGVLMDELAELKLANRTALLVTSDSGPPKQSAEEREFFHGTGGLAGSQGTLYEGGLRVPFIARWPGQAFTGIERDYAAAGWDLLPTLAELSGAVNVPKQLDGVSIASLLRGGIGRSRSMLYWELREDAGLGQAVRMGDWKVIRPAGKTRREDCELYNVKKDPREKKNVAAQHSEIVAKFLK